jgi:hypothetical protein
VGAVRPLHHLRRRALADYLLTQSNLQVVVERAEQTPADLKTWIVSETTPFFGSSRAEFKFGGFVASHRR